MMRKYSLCYVLALYILSVLLLTLGQTQSCDAFRADDRIQSGRISLSTNNNSPQSTDQIKVSLTFPLGDPQSSSCLISPIGID